MLAQATYYVSHMQSSHKCPVIEPCFQIYHCHCAAVVYFAIHVPYLHSIRAVLVRIYTIFGGPLFGVPLWVLFIPAA